MNRIGVKGGVQEILSHQWFKNINPALVLEGKIKPPLKPDILALNFDEVIFFHKKIRKNSKKMRKNIRNNWSKINKMT